MDIPYETSQRELRLRIGRLRRRINGRLRVVEYRTRQLMSWRKLIERYSGYAATAALGAELSLSVALRLARRLCWMGGRLLGRSAGRLFRRLWRMARQRWAHAPTNPSEAVSRGTRP